MSLEAELVAGIEQTVAVAAGDLSGVDMSDIRWEGMSNTQLAAAVQQLNEGPGAGAMTQAADALADIAANLAQIDQTLHTQLQAIGVNWQSTEASELAEEMTTSSAAYGGSVTDQGGQSANSVNQQGGAYSAAKNGAPHPTTLNGPTQTNAVDGLVRTLTGHGTDHSQEVAATNGARNQAVDTMTNYTQASQTNLAGYQPLPPAPAIGLTHAPAPGGATTVSSYPGTGGAGAGYPGLPGGGAAGYPGLGGAGGSGQTGYPAGGSSAGFPGQPGLTGGSGGTGFPGTAGAPGFTGGLPGGGNGFTGGAPGFAGGLPGGGNGFSGGAPGFPGGLPSPGAIGGGAPAPGTPLPPGPVSGVAPAPGAPSGPPPAPSAISSGVVEDAALGAAVVGGSAVAGAAGASAKQDQLVRSRDNQFEGFAEDEEDLLAPGRSAAVAELDAEEAAAVEAGERIMAVPEPAPTLLEPAVTRPGDEDEEHRNRYDDHTDLFGTGQMVVPGVLGAEDE